MKNQNRRPLVIAGCVIGLLAILLPVIAGAVFIVTRQSNNKQPAVTDTLANSPTTLISITNPLDGQSFPANSSIPLRVDISSEENLNELVLYVNGNMVEGTAPEIRNKKDYFTRVSYIPDGIGRQSIFFKATNTAGQTVFSNRIYIEITEPQAAGLQIQAEEGQTLTSIAEKYGVDANSLQASVWDESNQVWDVSLEASDNPAFDLSQPLTTGQTVIVPVIPIVLPSPKTPPGNDPIPANGEEEQSGGGNLLDYFQDLGNDYSSAPTEPIFGWVYGDSPCSISVAIQDRAELEGAHNQWVDEKGFNLYRMLEGQSHFEKIKTWPAQTTAKLLSLTDTELMGSVTYMASSYNDVGETFTDPKTIPGFDPAACGSLAGSNGLLVENYNLFIPDGFDLAYIYASRDQGVWERIPGSNSDFFDTGTYKVDLVEITDHLPYGPTPPAVGKMQIDLEVWGWQGSQIVNIGKMTLVLPSLYSTTLSVCRDLNKCQSDIGWYEVKTMTEAEANDPDYSWQFLWNTGERTDKKAVWQISNSPFPDTPGLIKNLYTGEEDSKIFYIDQTSLSDQPEEEQQKTADGLTNLANFHNAGLPLKDGDIYYVRVIPMVGNQIAGEPSNTVQIQIRESTPSDPILYSPPHIYSAEILEFNPLHFPEPGVCRGRLIVDEEYHLVFLEPDDPLNPDDAGMMDIEDVLIPAGAYICPDPYLGEGKSSWEEFVEGFLASLAFVSELWEDIKQGVVDAVGAVVCGGNETCKAGLMMALNAGLAALGIPPTIPNFEELVHEGIGMVAAEVAGQLSQTEIGKDLIITAIDTGLVASEEEAQTWLSEQIANGLEYAMSEAVKSKPENPGCLDEEEAHSRGVEPVCWPGLKAHLDETGQRLPASVKVRISRSATVGADLSQSQINSLYQVHINTMAIKNYHDDTYLTREGIHLPIENPIKGIVFTGGELGAPKLQPGQSEIIEVPLFPTEYWLPGHQQAINSWSVSQCSDSGCNTLSTNDWWFLYNLSTVDISVSSSIGYEDGGTGLTFCPEEGCTKTLDRCMASPMPTDIDPFIVFCQ